MSDLARFTADPAVEDLGPGGFQAAPAWVVVEPVEIGAAGRTMTQAWTKVEGTTRMRLNTSLLHLRPADDPLGRDTEKVASAGDRVTELVVEVSPSGALARSVRIPALVVHHNSSDISVDSLSDLKAANLRLSVAAASGGPFGAPIHTVPALPQRNAIPEQLGGASFHGNVLHLPDVVADSLLITVVDSDDPADFEPLMFSHGDVRVFRAPSPIGLSVVGPDGQEQFALPGSFTDATSADLTAVMKRYLGNLPADAPPSASIRIEVDTVGELSTCWSTTGEVLERPIEERLSVSAEGIPTQVVLPPPVPAVPAIRTITNLTVLHLGMELHPVSDPLPDAGASLTGPVVSDTTVVRALPPDALVGHEIKRIAVLGWPMSDTDLRLEVLGATATVAGLAAPNKRERPAIIWFDINDPPTVDGPVEISLTAPRGSFAWVAGPEPLVRVAVGSPPEGKSVSVGGIQVDLVGEETFLAGVHLAGPPGAPSGGSSPVGWPVETNQFAEVRLSNTNVEYNAVGEVP